MVPERTSLDKSLRFHPLDFVPVLHGYSWNCHRIGDFFPNVDHRWSHDMADDKVTEPPKINWVPPVHNGIMSHGRTIYVVPQPKPEYLPEPKAK